MSSPRKRVTRLAKDSMAPSTTDAASPLLTSNSLHTSQLSPKPTRRHDLDNLRTFLTALVIVHHTASVYRGPGGWYFRSALFGPALNRILVVFEATDQTFFMGLFFWISGLMSAQSLQRAVLADRKGSGHRGLGKFVRGKLLRLGLPAVIFTLVFTPLTYLEAEEGAWAAGRVSWAALWKYYRELRAVNGPTWYPAVLLVFDLVAAGIIFTSSHLRKDMDSSSLADVDDARESTRPWLSAYYRPIARWGWLLVAVACFFTRLVWPVGVPLRYVVNVLLGYFPQYPFAYLLGYLAYYEDEPRLVGPFDPAIKPAVVQLPTTMPLPNGDGAAPSAIPQDTTEDEVLEAAGPATGPSPHLHPESRLSQPSPPRIRPARYLALALVLVVLPPTIVQLATPMTSNPSASDNSGIGSISYNKRNKDGESDWNAPADPSLGGWNTAAVQYALWNEFGFVTLGPAVMACFMAWADWPATGWLWQARYSYAAFLLHPPVSVAVQRIADVALLAMGVGSWRGVWVWETFGPVLLTAVIGGLGTVLTFLVGQGLVRYVPGVGRVI
jgi:hypothetical protein